MMELDVIAGVIALFSLMFGAAMFAVLKYVPSLREFKAHEKQDDERQERTISWLQAIEQQIVETKHDIIRELKNGNCREHN